MEGSEFLERAKKELAKILERRYGIKASTKNMYVVFYSYILGYNKCTISSSDMHNMYAEVTLNDGRDEMYIDVYNKTSNDCIDV
jgi:hypothetical protein